MLWFEKHDNSVDASYLCWEGRMFRIKKGVLLIAFLVTSVTVSGSVFSADVGRLFNYGDSLTDQNNTYIYTGYLLKKNEQPNYPMELYPLSSRMLPTVFLRYKFSQLPTQPYYQGRFSDGPNFMEQLAGFMGLPAEGSERFINLAHGNSATVPNWKFFFSLIRLSNEHWGGFRVLQQLYNYVGSGQFLFPSLYDQVQFSIKKFAPFKEDDVFVLSCGANDNLVRLWKPEMVADTQEQVIRQLYRAKGRTVFWETIPDYTLTPCLKGAPDRAYIKGAVHRQNKKIRSSVKRLQRELPDLKLVLIDTDRIFKILRGEARKMGINVDEPAIPVFYNGCTRYKGIDIVELVDHESEFKNISTHEHFFFDAGHLTKRTNRAIAVLVCRLLTDQGIAMKCPDYNDFNIDQLLQLYYASNRVQ